MPRGRPATIIAKEQYGGKSLWALSYNRNPIRNLYKGLYKASYKDCYIVAVYCRSIVILVPYRRPYQVPYKDSCIVALLQKVAKWEPDTYRPKITESIYLAGDLQTSLRNDEMGARASGRSPL